MDKSDVKNHLIEYIQIEQALKKLATYKKRKRELESVIIKYIEQTNEIGFSFNGYIFYIEEVPKRKSSAHERLKCINKVLIENTDEYGTEPITTVELANRIMNNLKSNEKRPNLSTETKKVLKVRS